MLRKYEGHLTVSLSVSPFLDFLSVLLFLLSGSVLTLYLSYFVCLSQMGAVLRIEPVALSEPGVALPAAPLIGYQREGVWSDQVPAEGAQTG